MADTLYARLGGYDAIAAVADDLLARLQADAQLGRFWHHRGEDAPREATARQFPVRAGWWPDVLHGSGHEDLPSRSRDQRK